MHVGIAVFVGGAVLQDGVIASAPGVIPEYRIARDRDCVIVPIGALGGEGAEILDLLRRDPPPAEQTAPVDLLARLADASLRLEQLAEALSEGLCALIRRDLQGIVAFEVPR